MFIILYRWRIKPHLEQEFIESWSERSAFWLEKYGSLGSRLHRGSDGIFYSYAQWKSADQRERAFAEQDGKVSDFSRLLQSAVEESFPEVTLEIAADYLLPKA